MPKNVQIQKLEQGQALSPQQVQFVKMLELTNIELEQRVEHELEDNPALEEDYSAQELEDTTSSNDDDWDLGDYATEDDIPAYKLKLISEKQSAREDIPFSASAPSLEDELFRQLAEEGLSDAERRYVPYLIGNIDDEGYLRRSAMELQDDLLFKAGYDVPLDEVEALIDRIKGLDPAGVGAKDLQDCLVLQLKRREPTPLVLLSLQILEVHYEAFVMKRFVELQNLYSIDEVMLSEVYGLITSLSPRPASSFGDDQVKSLQYNPDFVVHNQDGELQVNLLGAKDVQPLRLSQSYLSMLEDKSLAKGEKKQEAHLFVKHKVEQARWFIDALRQRQETLLNTMRAIVAHQEAFFLTGDLALMRPMILKDIAEVVGMDISTISRVSTRKSVQTDYGIFPLKYFFGEGITNEAGESVSTKHIKQRLQELIQTEDKSHPLSDEMLSKLLSDEGNPIARRTVAKYREELSLPIARLRKEL